MQEPNQKLFDAMLIRAYRRFMDGGAFARWVYDTFGSWPEDLPLKRCKGFYWKQGVRAFVGEQLRPLADRLLDTDTSKDIETLGLLQGNWSNLDCELRRDRAKAKARYDVHRDEKRNEMTKDAIHRSYNAYSPNRKPTTMVKVPQGRRRA